MLTRHLYELDEVVAALQLCLRFRRNDEASFWLWELIRSEETVLAYTTLRQIWLDFGGGYYADTMLKATPPPATDTDAWLHLLSTVVQAIEHAGTASSVPMMLSTATQSPRPSTTPTKGLRAAAAAAFVASLDPMEGMTPDQSALWFMGLTAAIRTANTQDAAWLIQAAAPILSADAIWSALELITKNTNTGRTFPVSLRTAATPHPVSQTQYQMTVAVTLMRPGVADPPLRPFPFLFSWAEYDADLGRRKARRYPIPPMAIHTGTSRGQLPSSESNIDELRNPVPYFPEGCAYWRTVLKTTKRLKIKDSTIVFANAATKERFYEAHFPDDIPDEWSAADQQKSHGAGCAEVAFASPPVPPVREELVADLDTALAIHIY